MLLSWGSDGCEQCTQHRSSPQHEFIVRGLSGRSLCITVAAPACCALSHLQRDIENREGIPISKQHLLIAPSSPCNPTFVQLSLRLLGGKGGFGTLLRGTASAVGTKRTADFSAMRDLHGRRLRHVEQERALEEWREREERKTDDEKRREQTELNRKLSRIKQGKRAEVRDCRWGVDCKYRYKCRLRHPGDDDEAEEQTGPRHKRRRRDDGVMAAVADDDWQVAVVDEDDMMEDLEEGLSSRASGKLQRRRGHSDDFDGEEAEGNEDDEKDERKGGRDEDSSDAKRVYRDEREDGGSRAVAPPPSQPIGRRLEASSSAVVVEEAKDVVEQYGKVADESERKGAGGETAASSSSSAGVVTSVTFPPIDLSLFDSAASLERIGLVQLKAELGRRKMKVGGTLKERAVRLFSQRQLITQQ